MKNLHSTQEKEMGSPMDNQMAAMELWDKLIDIYY
jgi:hypothetical protein